MTVTRFRHAGGRAGPHLLGWVGRWSATSQAGSRRNAMVASTELLQRRREREDVEEFLRLELRRAG